MPGFERQHRRFTPREYLTIEDGSETRSEYYNGEIFAMTGRSLRHNRIALNVARLLDERLEGTTGQVFASDVRVLIEKHTMYTYPDILVVCGPPRTALGRKDTLTDATIIFEVLSPSTESYDRTEKFRFYRALPSLQQYVLLSQERPQVEQFPRQGIHGFVLDDIVIAEGDLELPSLNLRLPLNAIYRGVDWTEE